MNFLFLSVEMPDMGKGGRGLYADLVSSLAKEGHSITFIAPALNDGFCGEREEGLFRAIRVGVKPFIGDIPFYLKGIRVLSLTRKYKKAYSTFLKNEKIDIILMPTPPSSLVDVVEMIKKRTGAKFYLILRDIHPDCFDRKRVADWIRKDETLFEECKKPYGINPIISSFLRRKSQRLYALSDWIGCMSPGNQRYIHEIAPYVSEDKIVLLPNWYSGKQNSNNVDANLESVKIKYDLDHKFVAIFGGTIGAAQAVWNIAMLGKLCLSNPNIVILVIGRGPKKKVLQEIAETYRLKNLRIMDFLPREDYEKILNIADVGLISIDEKYRVPTCPSKVIGYMASAKPVLAMINDNSDYGEFYIDKPGCGLWSSGLDVQKMRKNMEWFIDHPEDSKKMGESGREYFLNNFTADIIAETLINQING